jgi:uncharacterized membrane protein
LKEGYEQNKMTKQTIKLFSIIFLAFALVGLVSAQLLVDSVTQDKLYPGEEASINVKIQNDFNYDVDNVKMTLMFSTQTATGAVDFTKPSVFSAVGSSQDEQDNIESDDSETFSFKIKSSNSIAPGDYNLPYSINYEGKNGSVVTEYGTIGVSVSSKTNLDYALSQQTKVIGMKDKVTLKIINKGFGEIKFVSVSVDSGNGYTLLSDSKVYIGSVASDDFETANFEVLLTNSHPSFSAVITYKDFENNDKTETVNFDLTAYSKEKALQLGIIQKSNTPFIVGFIILVFVIIFIVRTIRKRNKLKKQNLNKTN